MAITRTVAPTSSSTGGATTLVLTLGSAPTAGRLIVVGIEHQYTTLTIPNMTLAVTKRRGTTTRNVSIFYRVVVGGDPTAYTFTMGTSGAMAGMIEEWSGLTATPLDRVASTDGGGTNILTLTVGPTTTTVQAEELAIGYLDKNSAAGVWNAPGGGFTSEGTIATQQMLSKVLSAAEAVAPVWNWSSGAQAVGAVATFKAPLAAPPAGNGVPLKVWTGTEWRVAVPKYWNGSAWVNKPLKIWDGTQWRSVGWMGGGTSTEEGTANVNASDVTKQLLSYIRTRPTKTTNRLLSGQHFGNGSDLTTGTNNVGQWDAIESQTGQRPAVMGADFGSGATNIAKIVPYLIDHWEAGGVIQATAHMKNPQTGGSVNDLNCNIPELTTPGSTLQTNFRNNVLDPIADGFQQLENAGVPVMWGPFHEMNAGPWWWAYQNSTMTRALFHLLWQQTFDWFTTTRGLNNLLWVFRCHGHNGAGLYQPAKYPVTGIDVDAAHGHSSMYPGDGYVDIVGPSSYDSIAGFESTTGQTKILAIHREVPQKPFAIVEIGQSGANQVGAPKLDLARVLNLFKGGWRDAAYFCFWNGSWSLHDELNPSTLMNDPITVNLGEVDIYAD